MLWMPTRGALEESLGSGAWGSCLQQITRDSEGQHLVIIFDDQPADMRIVETPLFTFTGCTTQVSASTLRRHADQHDGAELSRQQRIAEGWTAIPSPVDLLPASMPEPDSLADRLQTVSFLAAWYWLAAEQPTVTTTSVSVHYEGVRDVRLDLDPRVTSTGNSSAATQLWQWATATSDVTRRVATQQAISYAVADNHDLAQAAAAVLRTAKSLHELAARDLISEALAARRSGRAAAAAAAATAVSAAQQASGKAIERSLAMLAAGAAVVFATVQKALPWYSSVVALGILAAIFMGGLRLSLLIDIRSARDILASTKKDLDQYRDTLTSADVQAIKDMHVLADADRRTKGARTAVWIIYSASAFASAVFAVIFAIVRPG